MKIKIMHNDGTTEYAKINLVSIDSESILAITKYHNESIIKYETERIKMVELDGEIVYMSEEYKKENVESLEQLTKNGGFEKIINDVFIPLLYGVNHETDKEEQ